MANEKIKPSVIRIERTKQGQRLYDLEQALRDAFDDCAAEWLKVTGHDGREFWTRGVPQALFDLLESYESASSEIAAVAYLEHRGYAVTAPGASESEVLP